METKYVRVPFNLELAKEITNGTKEGRIVTRGGYGVRILCFDRKTDMYPIILLVDVKNQESVEFYGLNGKWADDGDDVLDLMLEIPEYMTFKDGDIIAYDDCDTMAIINAEFFKNDSGDICSKSYITISDERNLQQFSVSMNSARLATEEEKQKFVNILKESKELKAKIYLKRFFSIEEKQKCEFKAGQPVIGVDGRGEWRYDLFSHYKPEYRNGNYICSARSYSKCLPYNDQTAHLLGTTDDWEG